MMLSAPVAAGLAVAFIIAFGCTRRFVVPRNIVLLIASYLLCTLLDWRAPFFLLASTLVTYIAARLATKRSPGGKAAMWIGIGLHVLLLVLWKEADFFAGYVKGPLGMAPIDPSVDLKTILLPLGISFYTFQAIGYIADVGREKRKPEKNLLHVALFLAFFPKLISGPIERAHELLPQIRSVRPIHRQAMADGIFLIAWGAVKKLVIAANAAIIADPAFANPWGLGPYNIIAALAFAVQLYADFSGYSDIARGSAMLMGFELRRNFRHPFIARSPDDFWKRWHITLSEWVRDYVYIPLGGNRKGALRSTFNVLVAMTLIGFWHGTSWPFILWGLYQGVLIVAYRFGRRCIRPNSPLGRLLAFTPAAVSGFFALNLVGWMLFKSQNLELFQMMLQSSVSPALSPEPISGALWLLLTLCLPLAAVEWLQCRTDDDFIVAKQPWSLQAVAYVLMAYALLLAMPVAVAPFMYARF